LQPSDASFPEIRHTVAVVTPSGGVNQAGSSLDVATFMKALVTFDSYTSDSYDSSTRL